MKKLLFTILAVMCCAVMNAQDVTFTAGGINYNVTGENTVEVGRNENLTGSVVIPATVTNPDGGKIYNVTGIRENAFSNNFDITSVTIPEGITSIGQSAFYWCENLEGDLVIPSTVKSIGEAAFKRCYDLTSVTIKGGNIGEQAFWGCSGLTSLSLQEGVTGIGSQAFYYCNQLGGDLVIPSTVKSIGSYAFDHCSGLTSVTIKGGSIGDNAFNSCSYIESISLQEGVTSIGAYAFNDIGLSYQEDCLIIPSTVKSIGDNAFSGVFANTVKVFALVPSKLGGGAFYAGTCYVPDVDKYKVCDGWQDYDIELLTEFKLGDQMYSLDETGNYFEQNLTFNDKDLYVSGRDFTVNGKLNYSRTFEATGVWQAWFVPFDVTVGKMNDAGMEVAQIADVQMGENEQVITAAAKMTNTDAVVKANTPYMVMATKSEVNMKFDGPVVIKKSADAELEEHHITIQSSYNTSKIGGIYHEQSNSDWYALSPDGTFIKINDAVLQAQRLWLTIKPRTDSPYVDSSASEPFIDANELDYFTTPCTDCPSIEVTKGDKTVKLYNPEKVEFKKE